MRGKDRPRICEWILKFGLRPYIVDSVWDGHTVEDDGNGRFAAQLGRKDPRVESTWAKSQTPSPAAASQLHEGER
jgi:hypothetical protein